MLQYLEKVSNFSVTSSRCLTKRDSSRGAGDTLEPKGVIETLDECVEAALDQFPLALIVSFGHSNKCYAYTQPNFEDSESYLDDVACKIRYSKF